jgi:hypothetical protein
MISGSNKWEDWFAAVAFAEAGEHDTAVRMAGGQAPAQRRAGIWETLSSYFAAAAFAEENCPGPALEFLDGGSKKNSFLETLGLQGVKVRYGRLSVEPASFLEEVGLTGVRVRYAIVTL